MKKALDWLVEEHGEVSEDTLRATVFAADTPSEHTSDLTAALTDIMKNNGVRPQRDPIIHARQRKPRPASDLPPFLLLSLEAKH